MRPCPLVVRWWWIEKWKAETKSRKTHGFPPTRSSQSTRPGTSNDTPQQELQLGEQSELHSAPIFELSAEAVPRQSGEVGACQAPASAASRSPEVLSCSNLEPSEAAAAQRFWPQQSKRAAFLSCWTLFACRFMLKAGPLIVSRDCDHHQGSSGKPHEWAGLGLILSLNLPKVCRTRLDLTLCILRTMVVNRTRIALHCDLECPRIVPQDAEIFEYVRKASIDDTQRILKVGKASARDVNKFGITALHIACKTRNLALVCLLIQAGGDVNAHDEDGETPLHGALATKHNYDIARVLIQSGADLLNKAIDGKTPLHSIYNNTIAEIFTKQEWIEDVQPDAEGMTITHFLAWTRWTTPEIFWQGHKHDTSPIWSTDIFGRTCLHFAASRGNLGILSYLLERAPQIEIERKDSRGRTPLHHAVQSRRAAKAIDLLTTGGCSISAVDGSGYTALQSAAWWKNVDAVKQLTKLGSVKGSPKLKKNRRLDSRSVSQSRRPGLLGSGKRTEMSRKLSEQTPAVTSDWINNKPKRTCRFQGRYFYVIYFTVSSVLISMVLLIELRRSSRELLSRSDIDQKHYQIKDAEL